MGCRVPREAELVDTSVLEETEENKKNIQNCYVQFSRT